MDQIGDGLSVILETYLMSLSAPWRRIATNIDNNLLKRRKSEHRNKFLPRIDDFDYGDPLSGYWSWTRGFVKLLYIVRAITNQALSNTQKKHIRKGGGPYFNVWFVSQNQTRPEIWPHDREILKFNVLLGTHRAVNYVELAKPQLKYPSNRNNYASQWRDVFCSLDWPPLGPVPVGLVKINSSHWPFNYLSCLL